MNISNTHNCFGCGVCSIACSKHIIKIELNSDGFYEPRITELDKCTDCGLCMDVCSYNHDDQAQKNPPIKAYAAWSKNPEVRKICSSGGVGYEVGRKVISDGGRVCGVRFDADKNQAEHYVASTDIELIPSIGSKYIQSYTVDGFTEVVRLKNEERKKGKNEIFLITGTPCQIDSFRRWAQRFKCEDHFIFLDFYCHGVPSKFMWDKYVKHIEKQVGKLTYVSWRNKFTGWHDSYAMYIIGEDGEKKTWRSKGDYFYRLFLSNVCLNEACYDKCRFKQSKSSADIRIGDCWGQSYSKDEKGVSVAIAFTERGDEILSSTFCELESHPFDLVTHGQLHHSPPKTVSSSVIKLISRIPHIDIKTICGILKLTRIIDKIIRKIKG